MNLLCSDNAFQSRGVGVEWPEGRRGQRNSPGLKWDLWTPNSDSRSSSWTRPPGAPLTSRKPWASFWQPRAHSPAQSQFAECSHPLHPSQHSDWQSFPFLCYLPFYWANWNGHKLTFLCCFLSFNLTELSILVYDYWLSKIHSCISY